MNKIRKVEPVQGEYIEIETETYVDRLIRFSPDHWICQMGSSWERYFSGREEYEKLYQEYKNNK